MSKIYKGYELVQAMKDINEAFKTFVKLLGMQSDKINELVQAVNQLNKRTRKEKE